ncbi:MAG: hypothetical protein ACREIF_06965 [Chthoniobacterales bacterium]
MRRNLILTTVHRIAFPKISPFFRSLQETGFKGDLVVFGSGLDHETIGQIQRAGARFVPFHFYGKHVHNRAAWPWALWRRVFASALPAKPKELLAHAVFHLFYRRHLLYLDFIRKHAREYDKVLLTDCRDVFFQADPFAWEQAPGLHVFLEDESNKLGTCTHHIRWLTSLFGPEVLDKWKEEIVSCAGTVFGDIPATLDYLARMVSQTMKVKTLRESDGDQGIHNYLIRVGALPKVTIHDNRYLPVMTLGLVPADRLWLDDEGQVLDQAGIIVPVLHQYDRFPSLREKLLKTIHEV